SFRATIPLPPRSTLFPYTTLFRSSRVHPHHLAWINSIHIDCDFGIRFFLFLLLSSLLFFLFFRKKNNCRNGNTICRNVVCKTMRSEEHTSELQSRENLVCRLLLEK